MDTLEKMFLREMQDAYFDLDKSRHSFRRSRCFEQER